MRKMKMDLDELVVESFETAAEAAERGTVHGHATFRCDTVNATCDGGDTCDADTCDRAQYTCQLSCGVCGTYYCGDVTGLCGVSTDGQCQSGICG